MSRQDGTTTEEEADAMALHFAAAAQQQAAAASAPFGMMPGPHGIPGMHPMMGMMQHPNFFGMNPNMVMNPNVAAMMAESQRQHQAAAFSQAAFGLPHNMMVHPQTHNPAAAAAAAAAPGLQPRLVHDAAAAPRSVEAPPPKRGPGRPVGSGRNRMKQHLETMKDSLLHGGGRSLGKNPQTGYPYFSDSPDLASQDSSEPSVANIHSQGSSSMISEPTVHALVIFGSGRPEMPPPEWYTSWMSLGLEDDKYYLSELQCLLRNDFVEAFGTSEVSVCLC